METIKICWFVQNPSNTTSSTSSTWPPPTAAPCPFRPHLHRHHHNCQHEQRRDRSRSRSCSRYTRTRTISHRSHSCTVAAVHPRARSSVEEVFYTATSLALNTHTTHFRLQLELLVFLLSPIPRLLEGHTTWSFGQCLVRLVWTRNGLWRRGNVW